MWAKEECMCEYFFWIFKNYEGKFFFECVNFLLTVQEKKYCKIWEGLVNWPKAKILHFVLCLLFGMLFVFYL